MISWCHPIDGANQWDGFNEPGVEHFAGSPLKSLAREIVQNSLDSHDPSKPGPVRVEFEEISIKPKDIPGYLELVDTVSLCLAAAHAEGEKAELFFTNAIAELKKSRIKALVISDFNTRGIEGPAENGTPYFAFMKAKGQSKKIDLTAGGSYGIGKFAPFATSNLRTVFVSTAFVDDLGSVQQYTQGKTILMSHDDVQGHRHQGVGFWGVTEKCQPVEGHSEEIPNWLSRGAAKGRPEIGTKLVIVGFDSKPGWQHVLAASIIENFFGAIQQERLEVIINKTQKISHAELQETFESAPLKVAIENEAGEPEHFENCKAYSYCLKSHQEAFIESRQDQDLGLCEVKILVGEGLPKKVAFLRNGMFISDSLDLPGLRRFSEFKDFVAVFQCRSDKGIALLRKMEPPKHDSFEPDRLFSREEQARGKRALKEVANWIREMLRRNAKDPVSEVTTLDELKEFFADESADGKGKGTEETNPFGKVFITAKPLPQKKQATPSTFRGVADQGTDDTTTEGGGSDGKDGTGGGDGKGGMGDTAGGSGSGGQPELQVSLSNPRAVVLTPETRRIGFTSSRSGKVSIALFEVGADSDYPLNAKKSSVGEISNGKILLDLTKNSRSIIDVELAEVFSGALKVVAHEI
jgi:hypothetical protein